MKSPVDNALNELDRRLREGTREHGQVFVLDAFRRQLIEPVVESRSEESPSPRAIS